LQIWRKIEQRAGDEKTGKSLKTSRVPDAVQNVSIVGPANAGTHNHRHQCGDGSSNSFFEYDGSRGMGPGLRRDDGRL